MIFREKVLVFSQPGALPAAALDEPDRAGACTRHGEVHAEIAKQPSTPRGSAAIRADRSRTLGSLSRHAPTPRRCLLPPPLARPDLVDRAARRRQRARADRRRRSAQDVLAARAPSRRRAFDVLKARLRNARATPATSCSRCDGAGDRARRRRCSDEIEPVMRGAARRSRTSSRSATPYDPANARFVSQRRQDRVRRDPVRRAGQRRAGRPRDAHARHREQGELAQVCRSSSAARCSPTRRSPRAR